MNMDEEIRRILDEEEESSSGSIGSRNIFLEAITRGKFFIDKSKERKRIFYVDIVLQTGLKRVFKKENKFKLKVIEVFNPEMKKVIKEKQEKKKPKKEEPVKPEPKKEEPVKPEPKKEEPIKPEPKKEEPIKSEPEKEEKAKDEKKTTFNEIKEKRPLSPVFGEKGKHPGPDEIKEKKLKEIQRKLKEKEELDKKEKEFLDKMIEEREKEKNKKENNMNIGRKAI